MLCTPLVPYLVAHADILIPTYVYATENKLDEVSCGLAPEDLRSVIRTRCSFAGDLTNYVLYGASQPGRTIALTTEMIDSAIVTLNATGFLQVYMDGYPTHPQTYETTWLKLHKAFSVALPSERDAIIATHQEQQINSRSFPGHILTILRTSPPEAKSNSYLLLQSYLSHHSLRQYTSTEVGIRSLLANYITLGTGPVWTEEDHKLWEQTTGSKLTDFDTGETMVGYMKNFTTYTTLEATTMTTAGPNPTLSYHTAGFRHDLCMGNILTLLTTALKRVQPILLPQKEGEDEKLTQLRREHYDVFGHISPIEYVGTLAALMDEATTLLVKSVTFYTCTDTGLLI